VKLSAMYGEHAGHRARQLPVPPRLTFVFECECGAWFRVTPQELIDNDGTRPYKLEACEPVTEARP
jgi:hypothetical protein